MSADQLLGIKQPKRGKASDNRLTRRLQQIEKLHPQEKRQVMTLLDAFIERAQLKRQSA